jgi:transcriptional regulator with XRE-family HTH domain
MVAAMAKKNPPKQREPRLRTGLSATGEQRSLRANGIGDSIAERLRAYRIGRGLTVRALASRSGVSPSMVSEAERGTKTPSIAVLIALSEALGISLTQLVEAESSRGPIHFLPRADHRVLTDETGVRREHLGPTLKGSHLEFVRFVLPAGAETGALSAHQAGSIEHAHVAEGTIEVRVAGERMRAAKGDSIVFPADQGHGYANVGASEATVYVVVEPLALSARTDATRLRNSHMKT